MALSKTNEIDIIGIIKKIFSEKRLLVKFCFVFSVIGVIVALNTPRVYTSTVVLAPENSGGSSLLNKFGSMTSMFGINIGQGAGDDAIYPEIYPDVMASNDFVVELFDVPVTPLDSVRPRRYYDHLAFDGFVPFWNYPKIWLNKLFEKKEPWATNKKANPYRLTRKQENMVKYIKSNISCIVDKKTSVITISVTDIDSKVAADMADTVMNRLQNYITNYRTSKAKRDLDFVTEMCSQCEKEYKEAQTEYAKAADSYRNVNLVSVSSKIVNLENMMQLKYNSYSAAMQQLQLAKQQLQIQTPDFTIIQNAAMPNRPSGMPKAVICILYVILGVVFDALWVLYLRNWWYNYGCLLLRKKG